MSPRAAASHPGVSVTGGGQGRHSSCPAPSGGWGLLTLLTGEGLRPWPAPGLISDLRPPAPLSPAVWPASGPSVTHTARLRPLSHQLPPLWRLPSPCGRFPGGLLARDWPTSPTPPALFLFRVPAPRDPKGERTSSGSAACRSGCLTHRPPEAGTWASGPEVRCLPLCPEVDAGRAQPTPTPGPALCADRGSLSCSRRCLGSSGCEPCCRGLDPQDTGDGPPLLPTLVPVPARFPLSRVCSMSQALTHLR